MTVHPLRALALSVLFLIAATAVLNTAGQGIAGTLLAGASAAFALACLVLAGLAIVRDGARSPSMYGAAVVAALLLAVLFHSLVISD